MKWKNIASETTTFFITATITQWQPLLAKDEPRNILLQDFEFYRNKYSARILAYVIMPEHYHLVVDLQQPSDLHGWLHDIQLHTSNMLAKWLRSSVNPESLKLYEEHANGNSKLAIWKEQARAVGIISDQVLRTKIEYIHKNPVRRGLVNEPGDWLWSSWRNYYMEDESVFRVDRVDML